MDTNITVPTGIVCTPEEYARSLNNSSIICLTRGESIGLSVVGEAGLISLVAVSYVLFAILKNVARRISDVSSRRETRHVFQAKPIDLLIFSLFIADFFQAVGAVMVFKWVVDGNLHTGEFCTAQGIFLQLGGTGVAMANLLISVYTFIGVWLAKDIKSIRMTTILVSGQWGFIILMIIVGNVVNTGPGKTPYESPTPYWGWISEPYVQWRIWGQYFWYWIALAFSIVVYVPLWLWSRGNIIIDDITWWKLKVQRADPEADPALKGSRRRSLIMLLYPFVYCLTVIPLSVVRWISSVQEQNGGADRVPAAAMQAALAIFSLSGACNVVLLLTTRPNAMPFENQAHSSSERGSSPLLSCRNCDGQSIHKGQDEDESELARLPPRS